MARRTKGEGSVSLWKASKSPDTKHRAKVTVVLPTGEKKTIYGYGPTSKTAIADREKKVKRAMAQNPNAETITVTQLAAKWLKHCKMHGLKRKSLFNYANEIRLHIKPYIGDKPLTKVTLEDLQAIQYRLITAKPKPKYRTAELVTIRLKSMFSFALELYDAQIQTGDIKLVNVAASLQIPKRPKSAKPAPVKVWTTEQMEAFLNLIKEWYDKNQSLYYPLFFVAMNVGLRQSELIGLKWDRVRVRQDGQPYIRVDTQLVHFNGKFHEETPKTEKGVRNLPISPITYALLMEYRTKLEKIARRRGWQVKDDSLVFPTFEGTPVNPGNLRRSLDTAVEQLELPRITFHTLRKLFATYVTRDLIEKGKFPPKVLQQLLGHATTRVAMEVYAQVVDDDLDLAVLSIGGTNPVPPIVPPIDTEKGQDNPTDEPSEKQETTAPKR